MYIKYILIKYKLPYNNGNSKYLQTCCFLSINECVCSNCVPRQPYVAAVLLLLNGP
jgi:hypothetical protein